jgi:solute carrier family 25 (mitochondrial carnitine/acylcarnitine transporter), member 20/29
VHRHAAQHHEDVLPQVTVDEAPTRTIHESSFRGFLGGVVSGAAKLAVGHPFDTIKVRLQVSDKGVFQGPLDCLLKTVRYEGIAGLYKGATPPLIGWMASDSVMLGSLTLYRRLLLQHAFTDPTPYAGYRSVRGVSERLPALGHACAGALAGWTVSIVACPIDQVKGRLQVQYAADKSQRFYRGPVDCASRLIRSHGVRGLYHGLYATAIFRSFFFFWWGSYDVFTKALQHHTALSTPAVNFYAGGLSAQVFWLTAYPFDVIKQRIMVDPLGGRLGDGQPRYNNWRTAARLIYREAGLGGFWRGFVPCFLRAFPANGTALLAFEAVMRSVSE